MTGNPFLGWQNKSYFTWFASIDCVACQWIIKETVGQKWHEKGVSGAVFLLDMSMIFNLDNCLHKMRPKILKKTRHSEKGLTICCVAELRIVKKGLTLKTHKFWDPLYSSHVWLTFASFLHFMCFFKLCPVIFHAFTLHIAKAFSPRKLLC